jgi:hypothetical protein
MVEHAIAGQPEAQSATVKISSLDVQTSSLEIAARRSIMMANQALLLL